MTPDQFVQARQTDWRRLEQLLQRAQHRLTPAEVTQLGQLYRAITSDLALAQRDFPNQRVTDFLNQLVARAHAVIYRGEPLSLQRLGHFLTTGFPQTFREAGRFMAVAMALLIIPALLAGLTTWLQPASAPYLLPGGSQELIDYLENKELWVNFPINERPYVSSAIMQNNIRVAFLAFSGGMLAGTLSVWVLFFNGVFFGALMGLATYHGVGFELATFVVGHGVIELSVIAFAGGTGLMLGWAIVRPGLHTRRAALALAGRKAVQLVLGCAALLVVAGLIEGFISPNENLPWPVKWGVGIGTGILLYSYLLLAGREKKSKK